MRVAETTIAVTVFGCVACGAGLSHPSELSDSIKEIIANRDAFVGQSIEVQGRIHVEEYRSLEPCVGTDPRCGWPIATTLHLVVPGETRNSSNSLDLYELSPGGQVPSRELPSRLKHSVRLRGIHQRRGGDPPGHICQGPAADPDGRTERRAATGPSVQRHLFSGRRALNTKRRAVSPCRLPVFVRAMLRYLTCTT